MNEDIVKGHWKEVKGKLKQQWSKLTDDQIGRMQGSYEELEGVLQKNYGYQKDEAKRQINEFIDTNGWKDKK